MSHRIHPVARRGLTVAPALVLGVSAVLTQTVYAASGAGDCFKPTLELSTSSNSPAPSTSGTATLKLLFKPPFIVQGVGTATGFLDQDSGAVGSISVTASSRFWTPVCPNWSYGWSAKGAIVGQIRTQAGKATSGSATAVCSFAGSAAGDVVPPAKDSKTAQSSTSGGSNVSVSMGVGPSGPSYSAGMSTTTGQVTPSTNPAGDSNTLLDGPNTHVGAGSESVVVVNLFAYISVQANGCLASWAPHITKSSASAGGFTGAAVEQELYAVDGNGVGYGMGVHPQSRYYRIISRPSFGTPWTHGPFLPPVGRGAVEDGPQFKDADDPPPVPSPDGRKPNTDDRGDKDAPLHRN
jgi:hypothetical protein